MYRLRQVLAFIVLLLFSLESLANISQDAITQNLTSGQTISHAKEGFALFSFITEENENEERDDDKAHGLPLNLGTVLPSCTFSKHASKINFASPSLSVPLGHQQVLTLICRLLI